MSVTIKQIAELAGVSTGTVDRALNNRGRIRPEVAARIKKIAKSLNYKPNIVAKSLSNHNKNLKIAVILHIHQNHFFDDVIKGISKAAQEIKDFGISIVIKKCKDFDPQTQLSLINEAIDERINAIVVVPINDSAIQNKLNELHESGFPIILLTATIDNKSNLVYVGCNYKAAGNISAGLISIVSNGQGNLLVFSPSFQMLGHIQRVQSLQERLEEEYPEINLQSVIEMTGNDKTNYQLTKNALLKYPNTNIIICPGADGIGCIEALKDLNYYGKIKIIVYDFSKTVLQGFRDHSITAAITQNPKYQGYQAIKTLFNYLIHNKPPAQTDNFVQTRILIKESISEMKC